MKEHYHQMKQKKEEKSFPPFIVQLQPAIALVYGLHRAYESRKTIGAIHLYSSNIQENITQIFHSKIYRVILIKGDPGIGKTTLVKQICIEWALGHSLIDKKLVFFLSVRNPAIHEITSLLQAIEYFIESSIQIKHLCNYLENTQGADVVFIIDGFSELSSESPSAVFFAKLIRGEVLSCATVVLTSRSFVFGYDDGYHAQKCDHKAVFNIYSDDVNKVVEILGFDSTSSLNKYAASILEDSPLKFESLQKHLQQYPHINAMCHNPAIMSMMVFICMCQPNDLPSTATKLYTTFVLCSVVHHLRKSGKISNDASIRSLKDIPEQTVHNSLQKLEKLSFDALMGDDVLFTTEELPEDNPSCYGLLQCSKSDFSRNVSKQLFSFLCCGLQDYFAAKYVSNLSDDEVYNLLNESFLVDISGARDCYHGYESKDVDLNCKKEHLSNMWVLYYGINGEHCHQKIPIIMQVFLSSFIEKHRKLDFDYLEPLLQADLQYFLIEQQKMEHKDSLLQHSLMAQQETEQKDVPLKHSLMALKKIEFKDVDSSPLKYSSTQHQKISSHEHKAVDTFSLRSLLGQREPSTIKHWHDEDFLYNCSVATIFIFYLFQCFKEAQHRRYHEAITISEISNFINFHHKSLLPHQVASLGFFVVNSDIKIHTLCLRGCHIGDRGIHILHQYISGCQSRKYHIKILDLCDNDLTEASSFLIGDIVRNTDPHQLKFGGNSICELNDIIVAMTATKTVEVFDISRNNITPQKANVIIDIFDSLEQIDISQNNLGDDGAILLSKAITTTSTLKMLSIGSNNISSTGFVAIMNALTRNTSLKELMLDGNTVVKDNVVVKDYTQMAVTVNAKNRTLRKFGGNYSSIGLLELESIAKTFSSLEELHLSHSAIGQDGATAVSSIIYNNTALKVLDINNNNFGPSGSTIIALALAINTSLEKVFMDNNDIGQDGAPIIAALIANNSTLKYLSINANNFGPSGAAMIANALASNASLEYLYMSRNSIGHVGIVAFALAIANNKTFIKSLSLGDSTINEEMAMLIIRSLHNNSTITYLNLYNDTGFTKEVEEQVNKVKRNFIVVHYNRNVE